MLVAPFSPKYVRWRHRERGYRVEILDVVTGKCDAGYYSQLTVQRLDTGRKATWSAEVFKRTFKPSGKKTELRSDNVLLDPLI